MNTNEILHTLRNPYGKSDSDIKKAQISACDKIESLQSAYTNMRDFANENGLDTATTGDDVITSKAEKLAVKFHDAYERLAPEYGYETRKDTQKFNPESANGKLMIAVCSHIIKD